MRNPFSTYGSRRHPARDTPAGPVRGRVIAQRVRMASVPVRDAEPIGTALMASLGLQYPTWSPGSRGGGPHGGTVDFNIGSGITGRDARRTGPLQDWRGLHGPVASPANRKLGAQGGPSAQPAFPSTGNTAAPGIQNALAGMGLPSVLRTPGV